MGHCELYLMDVPWDHLEIVRSAISVLGKSVQSRIRPAPPNTKGIAFKVYVDIPHDEEPALFELIENLEKDGHILFGRRIARRVFVKKESDD